MQRRQFIVMAAAACCAHSARAHHGWSSFDQTKPLYLEGRAVKVSWRNPHVELDLELDPQLRLPDDLARRTLPAQSASVDGAGLLAAARLPARRDKVWHIELAPLTRVESWKLDEIKPGAQVGVLGYSFPGEQGNAVLRAEYVFVGGKAYGMRSSPA
ncbi:DUF6152 family protein [Piscinibacter sp. XHJ-5]|uniref:DUF6152 family protein n=1 Tax=Piscinibacter sp. XHJ-5 TaxID=3037797 RepID=UPI002452E535|nr:DUF6152 family protein [Piscinibacter sp. XHJ-5]